MKQLAIPLGCQKTATKWLVMMVQLIKRLYIEKEVRYAQ